MKLLDLFCGAGGAAMGYSRAGFDDITGVDIAFQKNYPFRFVQADALEYLAAHWQEYDAIHASPPCQGYTIMHNLPWLRGREYPLLILPTLAMLKGTGKPYMLENVMGARHGAKGLAKCGLEAHGLEAGWLCGQMFGLPFPRHRLFASSVFWLQPGHPKHRQRIRSGASLAGRARDIVFIPTKSGNFDPHWREKWSATAATSENPGSTAVTPTTGQELSPSRENGSTNGAHAKNAKRLGGTLPKSKGNHGMTILNREAAEAMGIDWMNRAELTQAIPPVYCEYVGKALLEAVAGLRKDAQKPLDRGA